MKKQTFTLIFVLTYLTSFYNLAAQEQKDRQIYVSKPVYVNSDENSTNKSEKSITKKQYRLLPNSSVYRINANLNRKDLRLRINDQINTREIYNNNNVVGKYLFAYSNEEAQNLLKLNTSRSILNNKAVEIEPQLIEKFRVILDEEDFVYFTDGSFFIKFNGNVNFAEFASFNNLMLKKEFIDLNMGLYTYDDFNSLESKINYIEKINSVSEVKYNVINPYVVPH